MPGAHAKYSPSSASIWMNCPGAVLQQEGLPNESSTHAERGTAAHELLELKLLGKAIPTGFKMSNGVVLDAEDIAAVDLAHEFILGEVEDGDEWETETRLQFNDDIWGTSDFSRYRPSTGELLVVDYKHGVGVLVEAQGNRQGDIYALMKIKALGNRPVAKVRFVIVQPRCKQSSEFIREAEYDPLDMLEREDEIVAAYLAAENATPAQLVRGDHCRWCRANFSGGCPLVTAEIEEAAELDFADTGDGIDDAALGKALAVCDRAEAAIKATRALALSRAESGRPPVGYKLAKTKPTPKITDEAGLVDAADLLGVDKSALQTEPQLRTYAQIRDHIAEVMPGDTKKSRKEAAVQLLGPYVTLSSSGVKLVPESDPAPAVRASAEDDFKPI